MSMLTKDLDLLQFITQKCQSEKDVPSIKILSMASKTIYSSIFKTFEKFNIGDYCVACMNTIHNLFWTILTYSNNLKLTMFLCDRAILLFNEYIVMTKNTIYSTVKSNVENLKEVKLFIYKKTIGPLILKETSCKNKKDIINNKLQIVGNIIYNCHYNIYLTLHNNNITLNDIHKLETYVINFNDHIIQELYKMNLKLLDIFQNCLEMFTELTPFLNFTIIQKYNSLFLLSCLINSCDITNIEKTIYIQNIIKKCQETYKFIYLRKDGDYITTSSLKLLLF